MKFSGFYFILCVISAVLSVILIILYLILGFNTLSFCSVFFISLSLCTGLMCVFSHLAVKSFGIKKQLFGILYKAGSVLFLLFIVSFIIVQAVLALNAHSDTESNSADFVLVLGAGIDGNQPSLTLEYRLETALAFSKKNTDCIFIVCGGQADDEICTEASVMRAWLIANGMPENRILTEDSSLNTVQNIHNAKSILDSLRPDGCKTAVLSNGFHLFRARRLMHNAGLDPYAVCAPSPMALKPFFAVREYFSVVKIIALRQW